MNIFIHTFNETIHITIHINLGKSLIAKEKYPTELNDCKFLQLDDQFVLNFYKLEIFYFR